MMMMMTRIRMMRLMTLMKTMLKTTMMRLVRVLNLTSNKSGLERLDVRSKESLGSSRGIGSCMCDRRERGAGGGDGGGQNSRRAKSGNADRIKRGGRWEIHRI
jgi:hypothetical protein